MIRGFLNNYLPRHRNRINQRLHAVGIPLSFLVAPALAIGGAAWYWHVGCFVSGYVLQFVGHAVEGNDAGEVVFVKKMLGMPYTEYASNTYSSSVPETPDDTTSDRL
ncbi:MAG: DUF962 domain-containing protein [Planctomycetaceae bacterium]